MNTTRPPEEQTMPLSDQAYQKKKERNARYAAEHTTRIIMNLNHSTDADIIAYLGIVSNKQGFLKELIRTRMTQENFKYGD